MQWCVIAATLRNALIGSILLTVTGATPSSALPGEERPNVVVIVFDTLRRDRMPFYDPDQKTAPFLGALTKEGLVFENAWSSSSWTAPSTASIFTGQLSNQHGVRTGLFAERRRSKKVEGYEFNHIPDDLVTLPKIGRTNCVFSNVR